VAAFLVLGAFLVFKWATMPPPLPRRCDRVGACWIVDYESKKFEQNQSVHYLLETNYYGDRYLEFSLDAVKNSWLDKAMVVGQPVYDEAGTLKYAPCNMDPRGDDSVVRACLDAIESTIQVEWYFVPNLMPSWVPPQYIKANKLVAWHQGYAVLRGACKDCFYSFPVFANHFKEYAIGTSMDPYRSDQDKDQFAAFRAKALADYRLRTQTLSTTPFVTYLQLPSFGSIQGVLTNAAGSAVEGASVYLERASVPGFTLVATTNVQGIYRFQRVGLGAVNVSALALSPGGLFANAAGTLSSVGQVLTLNIALPATGSVRGVVTDERGNVASAACINVRSSEQSLTILPAQYFRTDATGAYSATGIQPGQVLVSARASPCGEFSPASLVAVRVTNGVNAVADLRRFYIPNASGFVRAFDTLENPTASPITVTMQHFGRFGSYYQSVIPVLITAPAATNLRYAIHGSPPGPIAGGVPGTVGYIFAGSGGATPDATNFTTRDFSWSWTVTVPANSSVAYVNYLSLRTSTLTADVQTQAAALANSTQPGMFDGLSNAERILIKNFVVPPI